MVPLNCRKKNCRENKDKVIVFDFDCTISGNGNNLPRESTVTGLPPHHFYYAILKEEHGKEIGQIFTQGENSGIFPVLSQGQTDWCRNFFGTEQRLRKLSELFKNLCAKNFKIIILTRGRSWHVACVLRITGLLKYVTSIGGNSSISDDTLWLNVSKNTVVIDTNKNYSTKDNEILKLLEKGIMVRYIDDDSYEHSKILETINKFRYHNYDYANIGKSALACNDPIIQNNCVRIPDFKKNGKGMTIEMMDKIMEVCQ